MDTPGNRPVYVGRVNAVIDYIEAHLGDELTVEQLSGVAQFVSARAEQCRSSSADAETLPGPGRPC